MRVAVFSDIHGNCVALDAMLDDLRGETFDQLVCLGDAIQGGPQPAEVVRRLRELGCPVVMGNADDWLITGIETDAESISDARRVQLEDVRQWSLTNLSPDDIAFIRAFQPTVQLDLHDGRTLLCFHGSPKSYDDVILPMTLEDEVRGYLDPQQHVIYTGGHTHIQFIRHLGRTLHFNPGSVGFSYRHDQLEGDFHADPWAEYAILTATQEHFSLEFRRVPFNVALLIEVYRASGRPHSDLAISQYGG